MVFYLFIIYFYFLAAWYFGKSRLESEFEPHQIVDALLVQETETFQTYFPNSSVKVGIRENSCDDRLHCRTLL